MDSGARNSKRKRKSKQESAKTKPIESIDSRSSIFNDKITRRQAISSIAKLGIGAAAVIAIGGIAYEATIPSSPSPSSTTKSSSGSSSQASSSSSSSPSAGVTPKRGGTLIWGMSSDPPTLNAILTSNLAAHWVGAEIFNGLGRVTRTSEVIPELATSWTSNADKTVWTFNLVTNAKWHDGVPFTSADVKFTIETIAKSGNFRTLYVNFDNVQTPDDYTAIVTFTKPWATYAYYLDMMIQAIIPKHLYDGTDVTTNDYNLKPVGTGPFSFVEYVRSDHITLKKNPDYFKKDAAGNQLPFLDQIIFKIIPDATSRVAALENGDIQLLVTTAALPTVDASRLAQNPKFIVPLDGAGGEANGSVFGLYLHTGNKYLADPKVRQAIAYAIDKSQISQLAEYGFGTPASTFVHEKLTFFYNPNVTMWPLNVQMANTILDQAGYAKDSSGQRFQVKFVFDAGVFDAQKTSQIITDQLQQIGITVVPDPRDTAGYIDAVYTKKQFDMTVTNKSSGPDPVGQLYPQWHSSNIPLAVSNSDMYYSNPAVDSLFDAARIEPDLSKIQSDMFQFQDIIAMDIGAIPLQNILDPSAISADYGNFPPNAGRQRYQAEEVFWKKGT